MRPSLVQHTPRVGFRSRGLLLGQVGPANPELENLNMKNLLVLLLLAAVTILYFRSRSTPHIETPSVATQTPTPTPQPLAPITITKLLAPLYEAILNQDKDADRATDSAADLTAVFRLTQTQPASTDPAALQVAASAGRVCKLMQQAITVTTQAKKHYRRNESGPAGSMLTESERVRSIDLNTYNIDKQWCADLARLRNQAAPDWVRLQQVELSCAVPVLNATAQLEARALIATRKLRAENILAEQRREAARKTAEAARRAAEPRPRVSSMQRIGGG